VAWGSSAEFDLDAAFSEIVDLDRGEGIATDGGRRHTLPQSTCDHETTETDYIERSDGQHKVIVCAKCNLILEDCGVPEPDVCTDGGTVEEALEDLKDAQDGTDTEPTDLHRDKRPEVKGHGPEVQRDADGSIRRIEVAIKSGTRTSGPPYRELVIAYYVDGDAAHVSYIESGDGDGISRQYLRMLALADDVVGRVPGVETVTRFEDEIAETRETYERDLRERCAQEGCYDMPDEALDSGRCREHTPREERR
jgi:hypothetical protein